MGELSTRRYRPSDEPAVVELYATVFGRPRPPSEIAHRLEHGPAGPAHRLVLLAEDQVVGHTALLPLDAWVDGRRAIVPISCDSMVAPEWQGHGGFTLMSDHLHRALPGTEIGLSFTAERPLARFEALAAKRSDERLRHWISWHEVEALERSAGRTAPPPTRPVLRGALRALALAGRAPGAGLRVLDGRPDDAEVDALARASASYARVIHVRDAAYLQWRWPVDDPNWTVRHARHRDGTLAGWVVSGFDDRRATGTGVIADVLADSWRATAALVRHAADDLVTKGASLLSLGLRDPRRWSGAALRSAGFARRGIGPPILTFPLNGTDPVRASVAGWYLTSAELV